MRGPERQGERQKGFSLLEVLVAFAILAISMGIIFQSYSTSVRGVTLSGEYTRATELAQSTLARFSTIRPLEADEFSGEWSGRYRWWARIQPADELNNGATGSRLYSVDVSVSWQDGVRQRSVDLSTLVLQTGEQ